MRLILCACALAACAGRVPPPRVAPPLAWFVGSWQGKSRAAAGGETTLRWVVTPAMGGTWLEGRAHVVEKGLEARDFVSTAAEGLVRVYVDSQGTYAALLSSGWDGKVLRWQGEGQAADGTGLKFREAVEKVDDDTLRATWEIFDGEAWQPLSEETLHRVK